MRSTLPLSIFGSQSMLSPKYNLFIGAPQRAHATSV